MGRVWSSQNSCTSTLNAEAWCGWAHHPGCSHNRHSRIDADNDCIVLPYRHRCGKVSITGKTNRWWSGGGNDHRKPVRPARNDAQTTRYHFPYCTQPKRFTSMCKQMYNMLQLVCGIMAYFTVLEYRNRCLSASVCLSVYVLMCIQPPPLPLRNSDLPSRKNTCAVRAQMRSLSNDVSVSVAAACKAHQKSDCTLRTKSVNECAPNTNNTTSCKHYSIYFNDANLWINYARFSYAWWFSLYPMCPIWIYFFPYFQQNRHRWRRTTNRDLVFLFFYVCW